jgi:hypothetical protein
MASAYKKGQQVQVKNARTGAVASGKFVTEHPGDRGSFLEIDFGDAGTKKYRPAQVTAA